MKDPIMFNRNAGPKEEILKPISVNTLVVKNFNSKNIDHQFIQILTNLTCDEFNREIG